MIPSSACPPWQPDFTGQARRRARFQRGSYTTPRGTISGVPPKTIRYYENIGLLRSAPRLSNGYRDYDEPDVHTLRFVRHARRLGFSVPEVASLLALWRERRRSTAEVKAIAARRVAQINRKLRECEELKRMLLHLAGRYHDGAHAGRQAMRSPGPKSPN